MRRIKITHLNKKMEFICQYNSISEYRKELGIIHCFAQKVLSLLHDNKIIINSGNFIVKTSAYESDNYSLSLGVKRRLNSIKNSALSNKFKQDHKIVILTEFFHVKEIYTDTLKSLSIRDNICYNTMKSKIRRNKSQIIRHFKGVKIRSYPIYLYNRDYEEIKELISK